MTQNDIKVKEIVDNETTDKTLDEGQTIMFPSAIIGIGGAGKKLVYSLLGDEWILEKMLRPRKAGVSNYDIFIVDTAKSEEDEDLEKQRHIKNKKEKIRVELQNKDGDIPKDLNITNMLLTKNMNLDGPYDLMGPEVIKDIKTGTGAEYWWFDPDVIGKDLKKKLDERENFNSLDFSGGVIRRRALGKAIFYKTLTSKILDVGLANSGRVAMVVGLGGGTGSGIFIDYAKRLKRSSPTVDITLFAVLPTANETERERANGFASLCELEYMHIIGDRNLFRHVILLPMGPTGYSGKKDNEDLMREFHTAFAYTFVSYFNLDANERLISFREDYEYAPFIVATSCITRYNIEAYKKAIYSYDYALLSKKGALIEEENINSKLSMFLSAEDERKDEDNIYNLSDIDNKLLINRIGDFEKLFFKEGKIVDYFNNAGYNSISIFYNAMIDAIKKSGNTNSASQIISSIINSVKAADSTLPAPRDEVDKPMQYVIANEFSTMINMAKLFSRINKISDKKCHDNTKKALRAIVTREIDSNNMLTNDHRESLDNDISTKRANIYTLEKNYNNYKNEKHNKVVDTIRKILNDIKIDIDKLQVITGREYKEELKDKHIKFDDALVEYANGINKCRKLSELEKINNDRLERLTEDFYARVILIDSMFDRDVIITASEDIKQYQMYRIMSERRLSIIDIILSLFGIKTDAVREKERSEVERVRLAIQINKGEVYTIDDKKNIVKKYYYDTDKKLEDRKYTISQNIIEKICNRTKLEFDKELDQDYTDKISIAIKDNNLETELEVILKDVIGYYKRIKEDETNIENAKLELDNAEKKKKFSVSVNNLYEGLFGDIRSYIDKENVKQKHMETFDNRSSKPKSGDDGSRNHYISEIEPNEIFDVIGRNDIGQLMTAVKTEENRMLAIVEQTINKLFKTSYNGIANRYIIYGDTEGKWSASSVILCMSSLKRNINIDKDRKIMTIKEQFKVDDVVYWPIEIGGDWDVCSTLFISGMFLDNLVEISNPVQGHYSTYRRLKDRMGKLTFLHHTYMLENGQFLNRELLPLENETVKKLFATGKPHEITNEISKLYNITSYVDKPKELDN